MPNESLKAVNATQQSAVENFGPNDKLDLSAFGFADFKSGFPSQSTSRE